MHDKIALMARAGVENGNPRIFLCAAKLMLSGNDALYIKPLKNSTLEMGVFELSENPSLHLNLVNSFILNLV